MPILCPLALLYFMCERSLAFGKLLRNSIVGDVANVIAWSDETASGNQLRADMSRTFLSFYWSIADLPEFFKGCDRGWWPIGILSHDSVKTVAGEASGIMKHILRHFFMGPNNFANGISLNLCGAATLIKGRLAAVLQDEKGHKQVSSVKGASGAKCCLMCKNVLGAIDPEQVRAGGGNAVPANSPVPRPRPSPPYAPPPLQRWMGWG
eukprot:479431-Pyramimonas_sp.AAC.2